MFKNIKKRSAGLFLAVSAIFFSNATFAQAQFKGYENLLTVPKGYVVGYTKTPPVIDGDVTDATWQQAAWTDDFVDIEGDLKPKPPLQTNIKMLWDDTCLYIAARVAEPHVWATLKQHDAVVFMDNDVELFVSPNGSAHNYFEIEVNPFNNIFDLFLSKPYRNLGLPLSTWDTKGMRTAVKIQGTLNDPSDKDKGWTVEMSIPFKALNVGNRGGQTVKEGTTWRINFSRVEWDTKIVNGKYEKLKDANGRNLPERNWSWSPQGLINMHYPERWGYLQFSKTEAGDQKFTFPYAEQQKQYLWLLYYKQKDWLKDHREYLQNLNSLGLNDKIAIGSKNNTLKLEATPHQFMGFITDEKDNIIYTIDQDGYVSVLRN